MYKRQVVEGEDTLDDRIDRVVIKAVDAAMDRAALSRQVDASFPPMPGGQATPLPAPSCSQSSFPSFAAAVSSGAAISTSTADLREAKREDDYWSCRRALRIWPVAGQDLRAATATFLTDYLKLDEDYVRGLPPFTAQRLSLIHI